MAQSSIVIDYAAEGSYLVSAVVDMNKNFSAGEVIVGIPKMKNIEGVSVKTTILDSDALVRLINVLDVLDHQYPEQPIDLTLPYLPYSRQDRRTTEDHPFSLKIFLNMIDTLVDTVTTYDVHSGVADDMLNGCDFSADFINISQQSLVENWAAINSRVLGSDGIIVSPDGGALLKSKELADHYGKEMLIGAKSRDPATGKLSRVMVDRPAAIQGRECIIFDDICDGGMTFINLAKYLKENGASRVVLYVTHAILSYGTEELMKYVDELYIYNYIGKTQEFTGTVVVKGA